jgi:hypothetical protein
MPARSGTAARSVTPDAALVPDRLRPKSVGWCLPRSGGRARGVHPGFAGTPSRILPGQPNHQIPQFVRDRRTPDRVRVSPALGDQPAVPCQQDDAVEPKPLGQEPCESGQQCPVGPIRTRPGNLTTQDRNLMTQPRSPPPWRRRFARGASANRTAGPSADTRRTYRSQRTRTFTVGFTRSCRPPTADCRSCR